MRRDLTLIPVIVLATLIITNLPFFTYIYGTNYNYQNEDASFYLAEQPSSTQGFKIVIQRFQHFKQKHPENRNRILYRTFSFQPWKFWQWWDMIKNYERYGLPYKNLAGCTNDRAL